MKITTNNTVTLLFILLLNPFLAFSDDWPAFRGPNGDGVADSGSHFAGDASGSLKVAWSAPAGSGYSGVSISNGVAVTGFSDGKSDLLAAFDEKTGKELWRIRIAETYKGHDGSHDGPIATPAIADRKVFAIAARGDFIAVDLRTGKKIWELNLLQSEGAEKPYYGFGSSPLVSKGVLVVQVGAKENKFIAGFDPATGKKLWSVGNDSLNYQSPAKIKWKNDEFVVAAGDTKIFGIDAAKGQIVWEYAHEGPPHPMASQSMIVVPAEEGQLLLKNKPESSLLIRLVSASDGKITVEKVWDAPIFKTTYSVPVYYKDHFYGFNGRVLSCVKAANGEIVWRSRAVSDGFPMIVDGNLVVQTKEGTLHVGPASPEGWTERAKVDLASVSWTPPSFSSGAIFTRGMKQIARIEWQKQTTASSTTAPLNALQLSANFAEFLADVEKATDKTATVEKYFTSVASYPHVEWPNHVYFLYRGDAKDVAIIGDMIGARQEEPMNRVPNTDLFWYHVQLEPDALITYRFVKNYDEQVADPKNPKKTKDSRGQDVSIFTMPGWKDGAFSKQAPPKQRGVIESKDIVSALHKGVSVKVDVYLPPGYKMSKERYPLLVVLDGVAARREGFLANALDHLRGSSMRSAITVFVGEADLGEIQPPDAAQYYELITSFLGKEVVKYIDDHYRTKSESADRAILANGFSGPDGLLTALKHPGLFGAFGSQSLFLLSSDEEFVRKAIKTAAEQPLQIYLDWGLYDMRTKRENWDLPEANRRMVLFLRERGYKPAGGETHETYGWASWRNRLDRVLVSLLPNR